MICRHCTSLQNAEFKDEPDWLEPVASGVEHWDEGPMRYKRYRCTMPGCGATWTQETDTRDQSVTWSVFPQV